MQAGVPAFDRVPGQETDVCLIVEGCYPHVTGGVASWLDWLIRNLPDHTFCVVSIVSGPGPRESKYVFPSNLMRFCELDLQEARGRATWWPRRRSGPQEAEILAGQLDALLKDGGRQRLADIVTTIGKLPFPAARRDLTRGELSWNIICRMYEKMMPQAAFIDFYWAWQSLIGGLFAVLTAPLPPARLYHTISTGYAGLLAARAAIETGRPAAITEHGIYTNERRVEVLMADWIVDTIDNGLSIESRRLDIRDFWIKAFESYARSCYQACGAITTLYGDNQKLQLELGAEASRMSVIPNGIDVERFGSIVPDPGTGRTVALVGRVVPIKDVKSFISAVATARRTLPGLRAYVLGPLDEDAAYAGECIRLSRDLGLEGTLEFPGRVNVLEWLPRIRVMALTSLSEAQPLTILEAGAAGIPCIATNVGSCREIIYGAEDENPSFGPGGIVTDVVAADQIAAAIVKLLGDDVARRQMGSNLRRRVASLYTSERSRDAYRRLYGSLLFEDEEDLRWPA